MNPIKLEPRRRKRTHEKLEIALKEFEKKILKILKESNGILEKGTLKIEYKIKGALDEQG